MVYNYDEYIEQRDALRESIDIKVTRKNEIIENCILRFGSDEGDTFISVREFIGMPLGERQYVNKGVYFIPIEFGEGLWRFYTYIEPGYFFGVQDHDVKETCKVLSGCLVDGLNGDRFLPGDDAVWKKGVKHKPGSDIGCEIIVEFDITEMEGLSNLTPALNKTA